MPRKYDFRNRHAMRVLRDAMLQLLEKRDFDHITVNEICMEAAMSRTTFYQHYQDKFDLLVDCIAVPVEPQPGQLEHDDLEGYFEQVLQVCEQYQKVILRLHQYDGTREIQHKLDARFLDFYTRYYQLMEQRGARFDAPIEMMATFMCDGVNGAIRYLHLHPNSISRDTMVRFLANKVRQSVFGFSGTNHLYPPHNTPARK